MDSTFYIDASQIRQYASKLERGATIVQRNLLLAAEDGVTDLLGAIRDVTPRCRSGNLQASLQKEISQTGRSTLGKVISRGNIAPYNRYVHDGRGPVTARRGKALRLQFCDGTVIFRRKVGPARANPFMDKGLGRSRTRIMSRVERAVIQIVSELAGAS